MLAPEALTVTVVSEQTDGLEAESEMVGSALVKITALATLLQLLESVPTALYEVSAEGVTVTIVFVLLVLQL